MLKQSIFIIIIISLLLFIYFYKCIKLLHFAQKHKLTHFHWGQRYRILNTNICHKNTLMFQPINQPAVAAGEQSSF